MTITNKVVLGAVAVVAAGALVVGGTTAFFSDTETSEGNVFAAGSVDIEISDISDDYLGDGEVNPEPKPEFTLTNDGFSFELADLKPLDHGVVSYDLSNDTNDAHICAMVEEAGNAENVRIDPEEEANDGTAGNPGNGNGELQDFMSFAFNDDSGQLSNIDGQWFDVGELNSGDTTSFGIGYCFGEYIGDGNCVANQTGEVNTAQTDSMNADISFYAVQTRNNEEFSCDSLNEGDGEVTGEITQLVMNTLDSLYTGISVEIQVTDAFEDAQSLTMELERDDGSVITKTLSANLVDDLVNEDRTPGASDGISAPFPIDDSYDEAGDTAWLGDTSADETWDETTAPVEATVTIVEADGTVTETTTTLTENAGSYTDLIN